MNRLQRSMFNRYFWFARWTDYLNRERLWRWLLVPMAGVYAFGYGSAILAVIVVGMLLLVRWSNRDKPDITKWGFYTTYCEWLFWFYWLGVALEGVAFVVGGIRIGDAVIASGERLVILQTVANGIGILIQTYLIADIFAPPRPRKKVKVSIKVPSIRLALPEAA